MKANAEHYVIFIISCLVWQVEMVLYLNQYAWWLIRLVIFHILTGCFQFYFCGNPSLLKACSDHRAILLPPVHSAEAMCMFKTTNQEKGLVYFIPICAAESSAQLIGDALIACAKWTIWQALEPLVLLCWGVSSSRIWTTKKWCCFPKDSPANIINSNWAQTRRKTKIEQGCSSPHCMWSSGRGTFVKFKENCLQKIHFA